MYLATVIAACVYIKLCMSFHSNTIKFHRIITPYVTDVMRGYATVKHGCLQQIWSVIGFRMNLSSSLLQSEEPGR